MRVRPVGYYVLASTTDVDHQGLSPEFRSFVADRYGDNIVSDIQDLLPPHLRPAVEADFLTTFAYRMGRGDGARIGEELRKVHKETAASRLLDFCHSLVPREGEHLDQYRSVVRHYLVGLWQGAAIELVGPTVQLSDSAGRGETDLDIEAELEAASMRFIPIWEYRYVENMSSAHVEPMLVRGVQIARLRDEADRRAARQVQERVAAYVQDEWSLGEAYHTFRADVQNMLATALNDIERNMFRRWLQTPVRQEDILQHVQKQRRSAALAMHR